MLVLVSLACTTAPPPKETPLGDPVPADYVGVDLVGLPDEAPWPDAWAGAVRLGDPALTTAALFEDDPEGNFAAFGALGATATLGVLGPPADPADLDGFVGQAGLVVDGVPEVEVWEVWDRPDRTGLAPADAAEVACALADTFGAERFVSPSPSWADGEDPVDWLTDFVQDGGGRCVSALAVHLEAGDVPDVEAIDTLRDAIKERGLGRLPLWDVGDTFGGDDPDPARVARALLVPWTHGVDRVYLHGWGGDAIALVDEGGGSTEAGVAARTVADWIVGRDLSGCAADGTVWTCSVRTEAARSWIAWDTDGAYVMTVPEGVTGIGRLDGSREAVDAATVTLGELPVLLDGGT